MCLDNHPGSYHPQTQRTAHNYPSLFSCIGRLLAVDSDTDFSRWQGFAKMLAMTATRGPG